MEPEKKPAWSSPVGKKLHQSDKVKVEAAIVQQIVKGKYCYSALVASLSLLMMLILIKSEKTDSEGTRSLKRPPCLPPRSRSLSVSHNDTRGRRHERWPRAAPGTTTFTNLPIKKKNGSGNARSRGLDEVKESLADKTRREMKALGIFLVSFPWEKISANDIVCSICSKSPSTFQRQLVLKSLTVCVTN
jgi:hypothetical protein